MKNIKPAEHFKSEQKAFKQLEQLLKDAGIGVSKFVWGRSWHAPQKRISKFSKFYAALILGYSHHRDYKSEPMIEIWIKRDIVPRVYEIHWQETSVGFYSDKGGIWQIRVGGPTSSKKFRWPKPLPEILAPYGDTTVSEADALATAAKLVEFYKAL
jgi:hypothetical protein